MIELQLFLGFPIESSLANRLNGSSFSDLNLMCIKGPKGEYIGKKVGSSIDRESLHNAEANVYSLLRKLLPDFPFNVSALVLFPCHE